MCSCGLVGYDARFTRERSPVRSWAVVLFFFGCVYVRVCLNFVVRAHCDDTECAVVDGALV